MANNDEIQSFLTKVKNLISIGNYVFIPRRKNLQALASLGLSIKDAEIEILELEVSDYYKGPKRDLDKNRSGSIWEFKKNIDNFTFYIKLKIDNDNRVSILKCLSFHEDEFR